MQVFAETVEQFETRWEAFIEKNALDEAAILNAMPPVDAVIGAAPTLDCELPY